MRARPELLMNCPHEGCFGGKLVVSRAGQAYDAREGGRKRASRTGLRIRCSDFSADCA